MGRQVGGELPEFRDEVEHVPSIGVDVGLAENGADADALRILLAMQQASAGQFEGRGE